LKITSKIDAFKIDLVEFIDLINLAKDENDDVLLHELSGDLISFKNKIKTLEFEALFSLPEDSMNTFLDIQAGSGGLDAQDWVSMLFKMYTAWLERRKFKYKVISVSYGESLGIKAISIKIYGDYSFGWLKYEAGIHRLVRKSPFDSNNKRHTSFASVFVYPDNEKDCDVELNDSDIKIDTYKSSGAGGQHVNTTESAVRVRHLPSGVVVQCQSERSQHKNKISAMRQLSLKVHALYAFNRKMDMKKIEDGKLSITWGNQIRSYILDKSLIKDVRSNFEVSNVDLVLNGDLDPFIFSVLNMKCKKYD